MENILKAQGFFLVDVDAVALNNAGKSTISNFDNGVATKTIIKNGRTYTYVSGQAVRFWWRNSLQKNLGWTMSPIIRESKVAFTNANPMLYPDDDVFGYMRAPKGKNEATVTRVSPLQNSVLISASSVRPVENWSSMARQEGDSVPYGKQEYSAIMKGMFCLDLSMLGTFSNYNKTGFQNLTDAMYKEAIENYGAIEIDDPYVDGKKMVRLPYETRVQRALDTISALKTISGGAMQTNNLGDVTPKFIILATTTTGNHPFSHVVSSTGEREERIKFGKDALKEVIADYKDTFVGKIFIGRRKGFFDEYDADLMEIKNEYEDMIEYGSVNSMLDAYCEQIKEQMK